MLVRDAMIPDPMTCRPEDPFPELLRRLLESQQGAAAVLDEEGQFLGMVGFHNVLRRVVPHYVDLDTKLIEVMHEGYLEERLERLRDLRVKDFMITDSHTVSPGDALIKAAAMIVELGRKTLAVVEGKKFLGMITRRSIFEKVTHRILHP
jgi:CBS domain-containing protein